MKAIGETFARELDAAGIQDRRFSWGADGVIEFHPDVSAETRAAVLAVYGAHEPDAIDLVAARAAVDAERDRRCEGEGAEMTFGGVVYQVRAKDLRNINGAGSAAGIAVAMGAQPGDYRWHGADTDFEWIAKDDSRVKMDAQTVYAFSLAAMARVSAYVFAGNNIKGLLGTANAPADITDDGLWP